MPNRRRFLQGAVAVSAAPAIGTAPAGAAGAAGAPHIDLVIYEESFAASRAFGQAALALGGRVRRIRADITPLWTSELNALWRSRPAVIAGMTTRQPMFVLEQLAWDAGLRVAFRTSHEAETGEDWPVRAAQTVLSAPVAEGERPQPLTMALDVHDAPVLYSWVIAPAGSRARMGRV